MQSRAASCPSAERQLASNLTVHARRAVGGEFPIPLP